MEPLEDPGVGWTELDAAQQDKLMELVREVAMVQAPGLVRARLESIEQAGGEGIRFLWIGGRERGDAHCYRIQGPTFLIEYDNTQNNANHIHLVWRDFAGDLAYVFDNLDLVGLDWDTADYALADYWVNFAAISDPNELGLSAWPSYDPAADVVQILDAEMRPERHPSSENLKYLEDLYLRSRQEREGSL